MCVALLQAKLVKAQQRAAAGPDVGASTRFRDSVSSKDSYGKHFGHYAGRSSADLELQPSSDSSVAGSEPSSPARPRRSSSLGEAADRGCR